MRKYVMQGGLSPLEKAARARSTECLYVLIDKHLQLTLYHPLDTALDSLWSVYDVDMTDFKVECFLTIYL